MKNKIEIQILSPATKEQLIQIRDEVRKIDGLEAFDLQLPPAPLTPGKMDGGLSFLILDAVIGGLTHFTAEKTADYYLEKIAGISKKILGTSKEKSSDVEAMSASNDTEAADWKIAISDNRNGKQTVTSYDEGGSTSVFTNREYSINPEHTYAILIGTSQYEDRANFSPIPPVAGNIDEMFRVLTDKTLVGIPYSNVTRLYNESCINIKDELRNISRTADIGTLIIYYSGHGQNTGNNQLSLIAKDTRTIDDELHNDIPYAFVEKMMNSSQADQKIIFLDACHSGLAAQGNTNVFDFAPVVGTFTLASTSADDSSYFKRDADNTYFTSFLTEAFKEGVKGSNTMLSLTDLYNYTSQKLSKMRLPSPVCKAQLKNITPDRFYISGNPSFSLEARLNLPKQLYEQGKYEEARREYFLLEKEYPNNEKLRNEHIEFERNAEFNRLVKEGDTLFFEKKDFRSAQLKYKEALSVKYDENVRDKISDCENSLINQPRTQRDNQRLEEQKVEKRNLENKRDYHENRPLPEPKKKKSSVPIIASIIVIALLGLLYRFVHNKSKELVDSGGNYYTYTGEYNSDGAPDGTGTAKYRNTGWEYEGEWKNGLRDGHGTFTYANGDKYTGYFKNGFFDGNGKIVYKEGTEYEGNWTAGVLQGDVKASFKNGNKYEGAWLNNTENGLGKFTWSNGDTYNGNFKDGNRDGYGTYVSPTSDLYYCHGCRKFVGYWRNNLKQGSGTCYDLNGNIIYTGTFNNDKPYDPVYPQ